MTRQLEIEFRVYRTRQPGESRECIATRSVPHALQVWNESVDAYSRSLELVISGDWLMQLVEQSDEGTREEIEVDRAAIVDLCLKALATDEVQEKQRFLKQMLTALGCDPGETG
jgi:hypothetical protein